MYVPGYVCWGVPWGKAPNNIDSCLCVSVFTLNPEVGGYSMTDVVGGLGFEFCVFVAGWRHALRSEWPFIIIIISR